MRPTRYRRPLLILAVTPALILLLLALLAKVLRAPALQHLDTAIQLHVHVLSSPTLTRILLAFSWLGAIRTFLPAAILAVAWLVFKRRKHQAILLGGGVAGALILNESLKLIFRRPRPSLAWSFAGLSPPAEHTFSFPSGHALFASVLYGGLGLLALRRSATPLRRAGVIALALVMPLAIGLSRVYFGVHYPSDVLAGYIAGLLWLTGIALAGREHPLRRDEHS